MTEKIWLRLVKTHGAEIICDQDGRPVGDVFGYTYSLCEPGDYPTLEVKVRVQPVKWDESLGSEMDQQVESPFAALPDECDHPEEMFQFDRMVCGKCGMTRQYLVRQRRENG